MSAEWSCHESFFLLSYEVSKMLQNFPELLGLYFVSPKHAEILANFLVTFLAAS